MTRAATLGLLAIGLVVTAAYLFPIYWMAASALKTPAEIFATPPTLFPRAPTWAAFAWIFERERVGRALWNSTVIASATTALTLLLAVGAAFGLARVRSRWMDVLLIGIMVSQVLPPALLVTPMFAIFRQVGLLNTQAAVILATATKTLPFAIVMLRTTFAQLPTELEEAARVDGCTRLGAFLRVTLPLARTGALVVGIVVFLLAWGEFVYPVALLSRADLQPATVGLYGFVGAEYADWNNVMAFATVLTAPVIVLFLLLQRRIVAGLTAGALK